MEDKRLGQTAYEAYRDAADGRSLASGEPLPAWPQLAPAIRDAWQAAALAVVDRAVHISEDEADVLVSKRRERDEELIPLEQLDADDVA
jgi:hypothetical protein